MTVVQSKWPARSLLALAVSLCLAGLWFVYAAVDQTPAHADATTVSCYGPATGNWENARAQTGDISRIEVESQCDGDRVVHRVRAFTRCAPRDCTWGWTDGRESGGRLSAVFTTYSAHRFLDISASDDIMHANVTHDFHDSRKVNRAGSYVFRRDD